MYLNYQYEDLWIPLDRQILIFPKGLSRMQSLLSKKVAHELEPVSSQGEKARCRNLLFSSFLHCSLGMIFKHAFSLHISLSSMML